MLLSKLKYKILQKGKFLKNDIAHFLGADAEKISNAKGKCILVYHGIDKIGDKKYSTKFISQKHFETHLQEFKKYFNLVSVADLLTGNVDENRFNVALTFDDGYKNNLDYAVPVLEKYKVPATFCITGIIDTEVPVLWPDLLDVTAKEFKTSLRINGEDYKVRKKYPWSFCEYVNKEGQVLKTVAKQQDQSFIKRLTKELTQHTNFSDWEKYATYWKQMTAAEIREIAENPLFEIASHGYYHTNLGNLNLKTACWEMKESKSFLENILQQQVQTIAYPDGSYSPEIIQAAKSIGYANQLLVEYQFGENEKDDLTIQNRLIINPYISVHNQILSIIKGHYF